MAIEELVKLPLDKNFGRDPWLNKETLDASTGNFSSDLSSFKYRGEDALTGDIVLLNPGLSVYGSYVDNYGGWGELVSRFGKSGAFLVSITIFGHPARCADVEPGAMSVADLPHWLDHVAVRDGGFDPWVYSSAGNYAEVNKYIGNRKVVRWSAHYGFGPHVCGPHTCGYPQADWTQWNDKGPLGQNVDQSVGLWVPHVAPVDPNHYDWFYDKKIEVSGRYLNERDVVEEYDRRMQHQVINAKRLRVLRYFLTLLHGRLISVIEETGDEKSYHRKWRKEQIQLREDGKKVV